MGKVFMKSKGDKNSSFSTRKMAETKGLFKQSRQKTFSSGLHNQSTFEHPYTQSNYI